LRIAEISFPMIYKNISIMNILQRAVQKLIGISSKKVNPLEKQNDTADILVVK